MKYKDLLRTIEIVAKYNGGMDAECLQMWAEHDEHGILFPYRNYDGCVDAKDLRELLSMGWHFESECAYDEETCDRIARYESLSDTELVEIFMESKGIYKYE